MGLGGIFVKEWMRGMFLKQALGSLNQPSHKPSKTEKLHDENDKRGIYYLLRKDILRVPSSKLDEVYEAIKVQLSQKPFKEEKPFDLIFHITFPKQGMLGEERQVEFTINLRELNGKILMYTKLVFIKGTYFPSDEWRPFVDNSCEQIISFVNDALESGSQIIGSKTKFVNKIRYNTKLNIPFNNKKIVFTLLKNRYEHHTDWAYDKLKKYEYISLIHKKDSNFFERFILKETKDKKIDLILELGNINKEKFSVYKSYHEKNEKVLQDIKKMLEKSTKTETSSNVINNSKFCSECGKPIKKSTKFCEHCGEKQ